jgi:GNAT superfamily N-acetyltransferase
MRSPIVTIVSNTNQHADMPNHDELSESHGQFSAAWSRYASCSRSGEVVDMGGLRIANSRHPWALLNAAVLTAPVSSQTELAARVDGAVAHFLDKNQQWFFAGGETWLGDGAHETLSRLGLGKTGSLVGMVTEQVTPPTRPLPDVETRRIDDEAGRRGLSDLNAVAYNVPLDWVQDLAMSESFWKDPVYGYNAYVDGQAVATAIVMPQNGVLYVGWVATAAAYRRRGLADLVMRRSLELATRETGFMRTALHATADGYPGYLKMGYRPVGEFALYGPV